MTAKPEPQPTTVAGSMTFNAPAYACPVVDGPTYAAYNHVTGETWRRERITGLNVADAIEVDILPNEGIVYFRAYLLCTGTWQQVADRTYTGWDGSLPLAIIDQPFNVTDPNVISVSAGLDLT